MLLSDEKVKSFLTNQVVPAWESVRPVPRVKIDFGNGKVMERTLKGNTVMYLCTPEGKVIDAFPGVYTPQDFLLQVGPALEKWDKQDPDWHSLSVNNLMLSEKRRITFSKAFVESPLLKALGAKGSEITLKPGLDAKKQGMEAPADAYEKLIAKLEDMSELPMRPGTASKAVAPDAPAHDAKAIADAAILADSRQNVSLVRPAVHLLLAKFQKPPTLAQVDKRIFKEILKIDVDDPYLGLEKLVLPGTPPPDK